MQGYDEGCSGSELEHWKQFQADVLVFAAKWELSSLIGKLRKESVKSTLSVEL